jgi:hypothetical protein
MKHMLKVAILFMSAQTAFAAGVAELAWLAGSWKQISSDAPMEALITSPSGGIVMSTWKVVSPAGLEFYEFEKIEEKDGIVLLTPYPFGQQGVSFAAKEISSTKAVFENPENAFPSRISYLLGEGGALGVRVEGTDERGEEILMNWSMRRN